MDPVRWRRVEELFHAGLQLRGDERHAWLTNACAGDEELRAEVDSLLTHESASDHFLAAPALDVAAATLVPPAVPYDEPVLAAGERIERFRLVRKIGEGGMGVVYEAEDERLGRRVALKLLRRDSLDPRAHERLVREARLAAAITHPNVCHVYELGAVGGRPFLVLELLEGESLAERLARGPMPPADALRLTITMLDALTVLHEHGVVHRDLKPSNVFLGRHALKLLDFGLARPLAPPTDDTGSPLTEAGMFVGTPQYASPEQLVGGDVDARSDVFSAAVIAFEMLAGRPAFVAATVPALAHAVMYGATPVLTGSPAVTAVDRVLHRALAKAPAERYQTADAFRADVRAALALVGSGEVVEARSILRLAVLPFNLLKPDAAIDHLGVSLADALASSLSGLESVVVRSTLKSARYARRPLDLDQLAAALAVDVVLTGSLLPTGAGLRVSAELVSAPAGDVWWSSVTMVAPDRALDLHDEIARAVLAALPLTTRDRAAAPAVRATSEKAFDLYLRGMQLRFEAGAWRQARAFFIRALEVDPGFAAAWAERGRVERILGKYDDPAMLAEAGRSLERALEVDPENGPAQHYFAQLDIDLGRLESALDRLLERAWQRRAEPHVYAALVHACRYAGLLDASVAAHQTAIRLDPTVSTSVLHSYYMQGDFRRALEEAHRSTDPFEARLLGAMGQRDAALAAARSEEARFSSVPVLRGFSTGLRAALEGRGDAARDALVVYDDVRFGDGEGLFYVAEIYAAVGDRGRAFAMLTRAVDAGFLCLPAFEHDVYLAPLRGGEAWGALMARLRDAHARVGQRFDQRHGQTLLGL